MWFIYLVEGAQGRSVEARFQAILRDDSDTRVTFLASHPDALRVEELMADFRRRLDTDGLTRN